MPRAELSVEHLGLLPGLASEAVIERILLVLWQELWSGRLQGRQLRKMLLSNRVLNTLFKLKTIT